MPSTVSPYWVFVVVGIARRLPVMDGWHMSFHTRQTVSSKCLKENRTAFNFDHLPLESAMVDWIHEKRHLPGSSMDSNIRTCYKRTRRKLPYLVTTADIKMTMGFWTRLPALVAASCSWFMGVGSAPLELRKRSATRVLSWLFTLIHY